MLAVMTGFVSFLLLVRYPIKISVLDSFLCILILFQNAIVVNFFQSFLGFFFCLFVCLFFTKEE